MEHLAHKAINKRAIRRWLSKALGSAYPEYLLAEHNHSPTAPIVPTWAIALHGAGLWSVMSYREVRFVHADPAMQRAITAAHRLGGSTAMVELLEDELRKAGLR